MTFLYPLAFLVLLAIPVLIVIYILRNKYKEGRVSSTYLWEVSQKFLKKKNPLNRFEHLFALIIQSLTIAALAVCLAHPQLTLKGQADNAVFVLDGSASMQIVQDGKSRFDLAKEKIKEIENKAKNGSKFSLILSGVETKTVCQSVDDKSRFEMYLDSISPSDLASDLEDSMNVAQKYLSTGLANQVYLATDKVIDQNNLENVEIIDVSSEQKNYSIDGVTYSYDSEGGLNISGNVYGRGYEVPQTVIDSKDETVKEPYMVNVRFYLNGEKGKYTKVFVQNDIKNTFMVNLGNDLKEEDLKEVTATIENEDSLSKDNSYTIYNNSQASTTNVLLVGDSINNYLKGFFEGYSANVKIIKPNAYTGKEGYDITIFNKYCPTTLPSTGAVWFIGCEDSIAGSGFIAQNSYDISGGDYLKYSKDNSLLYQELTKKIANNQITISRYTRYTLSDNFTSILTYNNLPVVFAGKNDNGQREINIGFDLETSDFAMKYDFLRLLFNFTKYSDPKVMTKFEYQTGNEAVLSLPDNLSKIVINTPNGKEVTIEKGSDDYVRYTFEESGTYTFQTIYENSTTKNQEMKAYSEFPLEEGNPIVKETKEYKLALKQDAKKGDAIYDSLLPICIACAVLYATDWILYAHEQY